MWRIWTCTTIVYETIPCLSCNVETIKWEANLCSFFFSAWALHNKRYRGHGGTYLGVLKFLHPHLDGFVFFKKFSQVRVQVILIVLNLSEKCWT